MVNLSVVATVFVRHKSVTGLISVLVNQAGQEKNVTQVGKARVCSIQYINGFLHFIPQLKALDEQIPNSLIYLQ